MFSSPDRCVVDARVLEDDPDVAADARSPRGRGRGRRSSRCPAVFDERRRQDARSWSSCRRHWARGRRTARRAATSKADVVDGGDRRLLVALGQVVDLDHGLHLGSSQRRSGGMACSRADPLGSRAWSRPIVEGRWRRDGDPEPADTSWDGQRRGRLKKRRPHHPIPLEWGHQRPPSRGEPNDRHATRSRPTGGVRRPGGVRNVDPVVRRSPVRDRSPHPARPSPRRGRAPGDPRDDLGRTPAVA